MNKNNNTPIPSDFFLYKDSNGEVKVEIYIFNETVWLTQDKIAQLFGVDRSVVTKHLKNIFQTAELQEDSVSAKIALTAADGKKYQTKLYNLDAILSVGYRVNSIQATHFRIWANSVLKEYLIKGFAMNDERLKNPQMLFGKDYFEEQLARIRDIRSSERRFYQKITDIYSQCSADYEAGSEVTKTFFATVQNKLHWAISGQTAAEIIVARVDAEKPNMGLTTWKNAPNGMIRKPDVSIAKNYLNETEMDDLNRIVSMYLDYAERQAKKGQVMYMKDWVKKLDAFLQFNEEAVMQHSGQVSHEVAKALAEQEYDKFHTRQLRNYESDFDKLLKGMNHD
ncbi:virulence RhuM family protein [Bacteroides ovatus]|uniref:virulence RhuM family protein n=1 Tax=Bacteroides ovatus TaxID=28116 RepID=UPI001230C5E6|nr:virulence RhuM family protein [Bacteroides ovatus]KAA3973176.1 virulence RhuM family protein [Bacteroides ovatus]MDC2678177.1 virulence RhuM family protein [Bacteroides ovatus]MDC2703106.1 virulence RhuM family protein [Bacteroides ovatus]